MLNVEKMKVIVLCNEERLASNLVCAFLNVFSRPDSEDNPQQSPFMSGNTIIFDNDVVIKLTNEILEIQRLEQIFEEQNEKLIKERTIYLKKEKGQ